MSFDPIAYINEPRWLESRLGLERIAELLDRLDRPQDRLRFVHVAGTNGKGSTCAYLASILQAAGLRTGLFTSPYLITFEERIRVDGANISADGLNEATLLVKEQAEAMADHPTEFELMCAVALVHFARSGCDIVVLEVGLGGRLDSTNVIDAPEVAVVARIGLDHTKLLGTTLAAIAGEKAGGDQHARVRGVGAGGDGGDRHVAMAEIEVFAFDGIAVGELAGLLVVAFQRGGEVRRDGFERKTSLGALRAGHGGHDVAEIEFQRVGEDEVGTVAVTPHALSLRIGFDQRDAVGLAAGHGEVVDRFAIDREEAAGGAVFRAHVADGGAVGERHVVHARAEEFDDEHEVGGGDAFLELAGQLEADDLGQQHGNRLAEHGGFRLDAADTPAENAEAVDHRGM